VVTSNVSSLPEAGAGVALCIDPQDINALSEALYQAITDQQLREKCQQIAPTIAQQFSAHAMVQKTLAAYEQAAKLHHQKRLTYV
jgi:UDP:flavonoid glycosyltransferase YjiC (YdhE family)